jgi:hypothetical protein
MIRKTNDDEFVPSSQQRPLWKFISFTSTSKCIRPCNLLHFAMNGVESEFAFYLIKSKRRTWLE